jgi:sporulation protein YlmC with PRC-barrel domain
MTEITLVIGCKVHTTDNKISGYVKSVVVDRSTPTAVPRFTVTHLVVEPKDREGLARLVLLDNDHVDVLADEIRLRYKEAEFKNLVAAEETLAEIFNSGPVELDTEGWRSADDDEPVVDGSKISPIRPQILEGEKDLVHGRLPGEAEEHHGDPVHATDGDIGKLDALIIDFDTHQVIHVLLKEGHFPWHHKEVRIPANKVSGFDDTGVHLSITKKQVQELASKERRITKIVRLKVGGEFDMDALEDGPGEALLQHDDNGWKLLTSEEDDLSDHGYLQATDRAQAVREARQRLESEGYEVTSEEVTFEV